MQGTPLLVYIARLLSSAHSATWYKLPQSPRSAPWLDHMCKTWPQAGHGSAGASAASGRHVQQPPPECELPGPLQVAVDQQLLAAPESRRGSRSEAKHGVHEAVGVGHDAHGRVRHSLKGGEVRRHVSPVEADERAQVPHLVAVCGQRSPRTPSITRDILHHAALHRVAVRD